VLDKRDRLLVSMAGNNTFAKRDKALQVKIILGIVRTPATYHKIVLSTFHCYTNGLND
jgi:hypothetical protein